MTIKLSDYMLEQSISESSVSEIALEQAMSEIEVCASLANAYLKQIAMMEYFEPAEDEVEDVVTEAAAAATDATDPGENKANPDGAISKIGSAAGNLVSSVLGAITGFFRWIGNKIGDIGDRLTKNSKEYKAKIASATEEQVSAFFQHYAESRNRDITNVAASYSPANIREFLETLTDETKVFGEAAKKFIHDSKSGFRVAEVVKSDEGTLGLGSNAENLDMFSQAIVRYTDSIKKTNPWNRVYKDKIQSDTGFKKMLEDYIEYYTSSRCISTIQALRGEINKVNDTLKQFDRRYNLTKKATAADYGGGLGGLIKKHWTRDIADRSTNPKFQRMKSVMQQALAAVAGGSKNSALGAINALDQNLIAIKNLGEAAVNRAKYSNNDKMSAGYP